jgi:hypothetical protein
MAGTEDVEQPVHGCEALGLFPEDPAGDARPEVPEHEEGRDVHKHRVHRQRRVDQDQLPRPMPQWPVFAISGRPGMVDVFTQCSL